MSCIGRLPASPPLIYFFCKIFEFSDKIQANILYLDAAVMQLQTLIFPLDWVTHGSDGSCLFSKYFFYFIQS
jgi:hypothetical protein